MRTSCARHRRHQPSETLSCARMHVLWAAAFPTNTPSARCSSHMGLYIACLGCSAHGFLSLLESAGHPLSWQGVRPARKDAHAGVHCWHCALPKSPL